MGDRELRKIQEVLKGLLMAGVRGGWRGGEGMHGWGILAECVWKVGEGRERLEGVGFGGIRPRGVC